MVNFPQEKDLQELITKARKGELLLHFASQYSDKFTSKLMTVIRHEKERGIIFTLFPSNRCYESTETNMERMQCKFTKVLARCHISLTHC